MLGICSKVKDCIQMTCPTSFWRKPLFSGLNSNQLSLYTLSEKDLSINNTEFFFFFFLSFLFTEPDYPPGTMLVWYNSSGSALHHRHWSLAVALHSMSWADPFSHGNCQASSGKHLQFLTGQFQVEEFKRQPDRVLMPCKIIMKDIYEKKKKIQLVWKPGPTLRILTADDG